MIRLVYKVVYKKLKKYYFRTSSRSSILYNLTIVLDPSIRLDNYCEYDVDIEKPKPKPSYRPII